MSHTLGDLLDFGSGLWCRLWTAVLLLSIKQSATSGVVLCAAVLTGMEHLADPFYPGQYQVRPWVSCAAYFAAVFPSCIVYLGCGRQLAAPRRASEPKPTVVAAQSGVPHARVACDGLCVSQAGSLCCAAKPTSLLLSIIWPESARIPRRLLPFSCSSMLCCLAVCFSLHDRLWLHVRLPRMLGPNAILTTCPLLEVTHAKFEFVVFSYLLKKQITQQ